MAKKIRIPFGNDLPISFKLAAKNLDGTITPISTSDVQNLVVKYGSTNPSQATKIDYTSDENFIYVFLDSTILKRGAIYSFYISGYRNGLDFSLNFVNVIEVVTDSDDANYLDFVIDMQQVEYGGFFIGLKNYDETIRPYIEDAERATENANASAEKANRSAENAQESAEKAQIAKDAADAATEAATLAKQAADNAAAAANSAAAAADNAADAANSAASEANSAAANANTNAELAQAAADATNAAISSADTATQAANAATNAANAAAQAAQAAKTAADAATISAQNAAAHAEEAASTIDSKLGDLQLEITELEKEIEKLPNDYFDITEIKSSNLLNPETCNNGLIISDGTIFTGDSYDNYIYTDFIPVESGKSYTLQFGSETIVVGRAIRYIHRWCFYDTNKNVVSGGSDSGANFILIPDGVSFVRLSINETIASLSTKFITFVEGETIINYEPYSPEVEMLAILKPECNNDEHIKEVAKIVMPTDEHIKEVAGEVGESYTENNLFANPTEGVNFWDNTFSWAGSDSPNSSYCTYMFEIKPNTMYYFYQGFGYNYGVRCINEYNSSKSYISGKSVSNKTIYKTGADTKYLRVSFYRGNNSVIEIKEVISNGESVKAFIPDIIYCAVGRTIDIYNNQVCANADKYHFKWICGVGKSLKRKFSVKGVSASDKILRLVIYDDYLNVRYAKEATLKIVTNTISTKHAIVPLGDSLTNGKNWLAEVETLSADKISYVGTYDFSVEDSSGVQKTGSHDGRSGAEPIDYLTSASFSKGGITYSNSWWNGRRFSFNAFKANTGKNPDCIQIWLGTNGIQNPEQASYIKQIVDNIRMDNTTIPIIVCDTIFRGNQNGIGNQGGVDGYSASGDSFKYNEDCRVITLKKNLHALLEGYANVYLVDLGISHDSDYNFETSEVPVNPRASLMETQQTESVHPTNQGYFQIADVLYSIYCAVL